MTMSLFQHSFWKITGKGPKKRTWAGGWVSPLTLECMKFFFFTFLLWRDIRPAFRSSLACRSWVEEEEEEERKKKAVDDFVSCFYPTRVAFISGEQLKNYAGNPGRRIQSNGTAAPIRWVKVEHDQEESDSPHFYFSPSSAYFSFTSCNSKQS